MCADALGRCALGGHGLGEADVGLTNTRRAAPGGMAPGLSVAAAADASEAALLVEACLFAFGAKEAAVSQFAQDAGALHGSLEALEQGFGVFAVAEGYVCQGELLSAGARAAVGGKRRRREIMDAWQV